MKRLLALILTIFVMLSLAACGGSTADQKKDKSADASVQDTEEQTEEAAEETKAARNFGWYSCVVPEYYIKTENLEMLEIRNAAGKGKFYVDKSKLGSNADLEEYVQNNPYRNWNNGEASADNQQQIGNYTWIVTSNDDGTSHKLYAMVNDEWVVTVLISDLTLDDPAVQTLVGSLTVDETQLDAE